MKSQLINNQKSKLISYNVALLLKEKGCRMKTNHIIDLGWGGNGKKKAKTAASVSNWNLSKSAISVYTQSLAIDWIRENFDIHIVAVPAGIKNRYWVFTLFSFEQTKTPFTDIPFETYNSYEDAIEAALEYVLVNLI